MILRQLPALSCLQCEIEPNEMVKCQDSNEISFGSPMIRGSIPFLHRRVLRQLLGRREEPGHWQAAAGQRLHQRRVAVREERLEVLVVEAGPQLGQPRLARHLAHHRPVIVVARLPPVGRAATAVWNVPGEVRWNGKYRFRQADKNKVRT